jgi:hypothetical protein
LSFRKTLVNDGIERGKFPQFTLPGLDPGIHAVPPSGLFAIRSKFRLSYKRCAYTTAWMAGASPAKLR